MGSIKHVLASKTVWGGVVALLAGIAGLFGFDLGSPEDQASIAELLTSIGAAVGGLIAIYGRIRADSKLRVKKDK